MRAGEPKGLHAPNGILSWIEDDKTHNAHLGRAREDGCGVAGDRVINTKNSNLTSMCETLKRRIITEDLPYDLEEPVDEQEITRGLMRLSQRALSKYVDNEPDLY